MTRGDATEYCFGEVFTHNNRYNHDCSFATRFNDDCLEWIPCKPGPIGPESDLFQRYLR